MRRPSAAREALGFAPLVKARGADPASIERVPLIAAGAEPSVFLAGRPAALRATDARRLRSAGLSLFLNLALWNNDRIVGDRSHARYYHPRPRR